MKRHNLLAAVALGILSLVVSAQAVTIYADYGPSSNERLVIFDSGFPGGFNSNFSVSGLVSNDAFDELSFQPSTGVLYGLGSDHLYTISTSTGVATAVATLSQVINTQSGFGFDPVTGLLHVVVNNTDEIINPTSGAIIPIGTVAYAAGDVNAGQTPAVVSVAFSNDSVGATSTTMYDLNVSNEVATLTTENENSLALSTVGSTGSSFGGVPVGFAITSSGSAFVAIQENLIDPGNTRLYTEDLSTGKLTELDVIGGEYFLNVESIAIPPTPVPEPAMVATIGGFVALFLFYRRPKLAVL